MKYKVWVQAIPHEGKVKTGYMTETDFVAEGGLLLEAHEALGWVQHYLDNSLYGARQIAVVAA